jgi:hypothetical protein
VGGHHSIRASKTVVGAVLARRLVHTGLLLCLISCGCAIRYSDPHTGAEHLWGFGQLRLQTERSGGQFTTVTTGSRVPGLCLDVGRNHFGVSLGYASRQRLQVVETNSIAGFLYPSNSAAIRLSHDRSAPWAVGHLRLCGAGESARHCAIVTGRALAGLGAGLGGGDTSVGLGTHSRQVVMVTDGNVSLDLDQDAPRWPGFNLFATKVNAFVADETEENPKQGDP